MNTPPESPAPSPAAASLRRKTALFLVLLALGVGSVAFLIGHGVVDRLSTDLGTMLARTQANLTRERIEGAVGRELALVERMAGSTVITDWLADEDNPAKRARALAEAEQFRRAFADQSFFLVSAGSGHYYFADRRDEGTARVRYTVHADNPDHAWFFATLKKERTINVDFDRQLGVTKVWINLVARDAANRPLAVLGTGVDLTRFLADLLASIEPGVLVMVVDPEGTVVAHPDTSLMEFATAGKSASDKTLWRLLDDPAEREVVRQAIRTADARGMPPPVVPVTLNGRPGLLSVASVPDLRWSIISVVDHSSSAIFGAGFFARVGVAAIGVLALILLVASFGFDRLVLRPLSRLTDSVRRLGAGDYSVALDTRRDDEIGELTRAFSAMARRVRENTEQLEGQVSARTVELRQALDQLSSAHAQLTDSIRYASLIQQVILPDRALAERLAGQYFVLWQPRDVVGGDFYLFRGDGRGCLVGVVDCAGHGVPGAFMTMIAHAAFEAALAEGGWNDPAAVLARVDQGVRRMLPQSGRLERLATSMDMGLVYIDLAARLAHFCGARIDLFVAGRDGVRHLPGRKSGINDRRPVQLASASVPFAPEDTFYLVTDGLLDQSGGSAGHAFGRRRLVDWITAQIGQPLDAQRLSLVDTLSRYRGAHPLRDDITVVACRFTPQPVPIAEEIPPR